MVVATAARPPREPGDRYVRPYDVRVRFRDVLRRPTPKRTRAHGWTVLVASLWLLVVPTACSSAAPTAQPAHSPVRVTITDGCPRSIAHRDGVKNSGVGLASRIVPGTPRTALICRYSPLGGEQGADVVHGVLYGSLQVTASEAQRLAALIDKIPHDSGGAHSCPADMGRIDVLAFALPSRSDLDVWASSTGCWSFTNGVRLTGAPSPALEAYETLIDRLVPGITVLHAASGRADGTLMGRLLAVGGPSGPARPLPGKITIAGPVTQTVIVGTDGRFQVLLPPGKYAVTGISPLYNGGRGRCRALRPVTVTGGTTARDDVFCQEK